MNCLPFATIKPFNFAKSHLNATKRFLSIAKLFLTRLNLRQINENSQYVNVFKTNQHFLQLAVSSMRTDMQSHKHEIFSETVNKIALSADDDKRIILDDKISTLAFGHGGLA